MITSNEHKIEIKSYIELRRIFYVADHIFASNNRSFKMTIYTLKEFVNTFLASSELSSDSLSTNLKAA